MVGFFEKKKTPEEIEKERKRLQYEKVMKVAELKLPEQMDYSQKKRPADYKEFLKELKSKPESFYEKACEFSEKILKINASPAMSKNLDASLKAAYINATPTGVLSFAVIIGTVLFLLLIIGLLLGLGLAMWLFLTVLASMFAYYVYNIPASRAKSMTLKMSSDTVLAILYMIVYMRNSPNLEGAIKFAAQNLKGPLSWDLKKLVWDIETGKYRSADEALLFYVEKWKDKNKEFSEALHLLRGSAVESGRRDVVYDETLSIILTGTRDRAKHYSGELRMPVTIIHALGVLLPVMGLVLFPVVIIFMADTVKPIFLFIGYNVILPGVLYFFIQNTLEKKPTTFSQPDISLARGVPPIGKISIGGKLLSIWPFAILFSLPFFIVGYLGLGDADIYNSVTFSLLLIIGIAVLIGVYAYLDALQKVKIRKEIEQIESEFPVALFQLGNSLSGGIPIEVAIDNAREKLKSLKVVELFDIVSVNMKKFGYTFEQALFDRDVGAIYMYPSNMIHSVMRAIIESSKKGVERASDTMIVVSNYLKNVHEVKESIDETLGETVSSMKFLSMFLTPMVAGITVTMAVIIIRILTSVSTTFSQLNVGANAAQTMFLVPWLAGGSMPVTPPVFQMIVGIYMLQTVIILTIFVNRLLYGDDAIGERSALWKNLAIGTGVYFLSWILVYSLFGGPITAMLSPV